MQSQSSSIPPGFEPSPIGDGFIDHIGIPYARREADGTYVLAFRAQKHHLNIRNVVHGGMLSAFADVAIGMNLARSAVHIGSEPLATLNLSVDFIGTARDGDWVEASVSLSKKAGKVRFGHCDVRANGRLVVQAKGVFYVSDAVRSHGVA